MSMPDILTDATQNQAPSIDIDLFGPDTLPDNIKEIQLCSQGSQAIIEDELLKNDPHSQQSIQKSLFKFQINQVFDDEQEQNIETGVGKPIVQYYKKPRRKYTVKKQTEKPKTNLENKLENDFRQGNLKNKGRYDENRVSQRFLTHREQAPLSNQLTTFDVQRLKKYVREKSRLGNHKIQQLKWRQSFLKNQFSDQVECLNSLTPVAAYQTISCSTQQKPVLKNNLIKHMSRPRQYSGQYTMRQIDLQGVKTHIDMQKQSEDFNTKMQPEIKDLVTAYQTNRNQKFMSRLQNLGCVYKPSSTKNKPSEDQQGLYQLTLQYKKNNFMDSTNSSKMYTKSSKNLFFQSSIRDSKSNLQVKSKEREQSVLLPQVKYKTKLHKENR